jgi:uncharacterized membrane protein YqjE
MWKTALKFAAILFLKNRMQFAKINFFKKLNAKSNHDLNRLKQNIATMAESRAEIFKQNFNQEVKRVVNSLFGFMLILLAAIFSLLTGLMWLFALAWVSPNRDIILGVTMVLPILIAVGVYFYIRNSWQKQPILQQSMLQIESDWQILRDGLGTAQTTSDSMVDANRQ